MGCRKWLGQARACYRGTIDQRKLGKMSASSLWMPGNINIPLNHCLLCISTSFRVLRPPECWSKYFFLYDFNLFCSFLMFFSDFLPEIKKKVLKNSVFSYSLELVDKQTLVDSLVENG